MKQFCIYLVIRKINKITNFGYGKSSEKLINQFCMKQMKQFYIKLLEKLPSLPKAMRQFCIYPLIRKISKITYFAYIKSLEKLIITNFS